MKSTKCANDAPLVTLGNCIFLMVARRCRMRSPQSRRRQGTGRRRNAYGSFMMDNINARSIF